MPDLDHERLKAYAKHVFDALAGTMTSAMIHLGDRLGLYRALADGEPTTSAALAAKTGLHERWLREWLCQQGAAGVLEYRGEGRFALSAEGAAVLAHEDSPAFGAGFFAHLPQTLGVLDRLPEAFRTGIGLPYDAFGPEGAAGIERGFAPWFRALLVPLALPQLDGVVERLADGALAADVGCGAGVALLEMAKAFPRSEFHGWDISRHALARAEENRVQAGITNAVFHDAGRDPLPDDARFTLITTFDCLHDMTDPAGVVRQRHQGAPDLRGERRPESDGRAHVRDVRRHLSLVGALRSGGRRPRHARPARRAGGAHGARCGLHALHRGRPWAPGQRVLRRAAVTCPPASCFPAAGGDVC
jgi:SAM-dependent methyltransferase